MTPVFTTSEAGYLYLNFEDEDRTQDYVSLNNSKIISSRGNQVLDVTEDSFAEISLPFNIETEQGFASFWVKPVFVKKNPESHTFLSFSWNDDKKSYFAISSGWWEPIGSYRLYFILSNEDILHCSLPYRLQPDKWVMISAAWKTGDDGYCKLFVNGEKLAEHYNNASISHYSRGKLYVGTDKGASDRRGRYANALMDNLIVSTMDVNEKYIYEKYLEEKIHFTELNHKAEPFEKKVIENATGSNGGKTFESRVIFDEDIYWATSKSATDKVLNRIKAAGFNVYIPCVWHGKGAYFKSKHVDMDNRLRHLTHDPLNYLVKKAKALNIEVHPWITVLRRENGYLPEFSSAGVPRDSFNVHDVKFREFIVALMMEVVANYDIDGINLDYIRSHGFCTNIQCQNIYRSKYKRTLSLDLLKRKIPGVWIESIADWNYGAVTAIVNDISFKAKKVKPYIVISVDAHPLNRDLILQGQDSVKWANQGIVDVVYAMEYKRNTDYSRLDKIITSFIKPDSVVVLFSVFDKIDNKYVPRDLDYLLETVSLSRKKYGAHGAAYYVYNKLTDEQLMFFKQHLFKNYAIPHWKYISNEHQAN